MEQKEKDRSRFFQKKVNGSRKGQTNIPEDSLTSIDFLGKKKNYEIIVEKKTEKQEVYEIVTYKNDKYKNVYCQTFSLNSQRICEYLNQQMNELQKYSCPKEIIVVKKESIPGIAAYEHETDRLYISEELVENHKIKEFLGNHYFASESLDDILIHELKGHKQHWDSVKRFQEINHIESLDEAKQELERKLRVYVKNALSQDKNYIRNIVSENAMNGFIEKAKSFDIDIRLNELIADVKVLIEKEKLKDDNLKNLVEEVLAYDAIT